MITVKVGTNLVKIVGKEVHTLNVDLKTVIEGLIPTGDWAPVYPTPEAQVLATLIKWGFKPEVMYADPAPKVDPDVVY